MEEQQLFTRMHDALDVPTPPGAYERLRTQLTKKPVRQFRWPALQTRWSKMSFRFAAGLAIIAIVAAAAAAAVAIHNSTNNVAPAGPRMSILAYQTMVSNDNAAALSTYSGPCDIGVHSGCSADATRAIPVLQKWIDDLSRPDTPGRFVVINAEMRQHLSQSLAAQSDIIAAVKANNGPATDRAFIVAVFGADWTGTVVPGIVASKQVDATTYTRQVAQQVKQNSDSCANCTLLTSADAKSCTTNGGVPCLDLFDYVAFDFAVFSTTLVQYAAPDSLAAKDARLQNDLASADAVLLVMRLAVANNDQAGINSGITQLLRLKSQIVFDAAKITG
jgi:hypothetical protein